MSETLVIEKLIYGGEGLSRTNGEVIFTPFVLPGEKVEAERTGPRKGAQRARVVAITEPAPARTTPRCPYFGRCGGCQYQHAEYDAQLLAKRQILSETLQRVGHIDFPADAIAAIPSEPYEYRNRVQLHVENGRIGYREMNSRKLVSIDHCPISSPKINEAIKALDRMSRDRRWPRSLQTIEIFTDEQQVQWNVKADRPLAKHFFDWLAEQVPGTVPGTLEYEVADDRFLVSGESFFQVNRFLIEPLRKAALSDASGTSAWDLYAGVGLFSIPLARRFERVAAVESGRASAADLKRNAQRAMLPIKIVQQPTEAFVLESNNAPDFVLADPPRAGLEKIVANRLLELAPQRLTIIACDPSTLARDLTVLKAGYEIEKLTVADLFPQTFHIETVAQLKRRSA